MVIHKLVTCSLFVLFTVTFMYFWLCWVFVATHGLSLVMESRGSSLVLVRGLLIAEASLVTEHRLSSCGSWALENRLSSCVARA